MPSRHRLGKHYEAVRYVSLDDHLGSGPSCAVLGLKPQPTAYRRRSAEALSGFPLVNYLPVTLRARA
jgi:hypothetical protein